MYKWLGMKVLKWKDVKELHSKGELTGCYKLYPDGTESEILSNYDWTEIEQHHECDGGFGQELPTVDLKLLDGKRIVAPEVVDISAIDTLDELEYSLWGTIEEYLSLFGIRTEDDSPDFATVKAVQDKLLEVLMDAGIKFQFFDDCESQDKNDDISSFEVNIPVLVKQEDINAIMSSALETGILHWCDDVTTMDDSLGENAADHISQNGSLILQDKITSKTHLLNKSKFIEGLQKYISFYGNGTNFLVQEKDQFGKYTGRICVNGRYLALTPIDADYVIQYALFGTIIYK